MNTATSFSLSKLPDADRLGVAASVLCAIHCGLAPVLLLTLPAFGKVWAHPASHALVAILIVPLAIFSIRRGFQGHRRRWVALVAGVGISCVLIGAILPALTPKKSIPTANQEGVVEVAALETCSEEGCPAGYETGSEGDTTASALGCVDHCCPSAQVSETGEVSLHIPPAAFVTTLGGVFLIIAHLGNLIGCRHCGPTKMTEQNV